MDPDVRRGIFTLEIDESHEIGAAPTLQWAGRRPDVLATLLTPFHRFSGQREQGAQQRT